MTYWGLSKGKKVGGKKKNWGFQITPDEAARDAGVEEGALLRGEKCQKYVMPTETPKRNSPRLLGRVCVLAMQRLGGATVRGKKFNIGTLILKYNAAYTYGRGGMRHGTAAAR